MDFTPVIQNNFFKEGFLGYGEKGDITAFSLAHILPLVIGIGLVLLIYFNRDKIRKSKHENTYCVILGIFCIIGELLYYWRLCYVGSGGTKSELTHMLTKFPLQVCDLTAIVSSIMMLNKNKTCYQYCAYVCFTLGLIPLFTVEQITTCGPAYLRYYQYWIQHIIPIVSTFYMMFVHNFIIEKKGIFITLALLYPLAAISMYANITIPGAHFMYLVGDTFIAKYLPDSQILRILIMTAAAIPLFCIVYHLIHKYNLKEEKRLKA